MLVVVIEVKVDVIPVYNHVPAILVCLQLCQQSFVTLKGTSLNLCRAFLFQAIARLAFFDILVNKIKKSRKSFKNGKSFLNLINNDLPSNLKKKDSKKLQVQMMLSRES